MSQQLRTTRRRRRADAWSLVLSSQGIPHAIQRGEAGFELWVDDEEAARGERALAAYDAENQPEPETPPVPEWGPTPVGFFTAAAMIVFQALVTSDPTSPWYARGSADAEAILAGELWRTLTALTLHAGPGHLLGNTLSCALFGTFLCRWVGPGVGLMGMLVAGGLGNLLTAAAHGDAHVSVGASTALFGAIGLLAGRMVVVRSAPGLGLRVGRVGARRRAAWVPLAGGLGLFAMLGTGGERTDLLAHLFGLLSGTVLGALSGYALPRPAGATLQLLLFAAAALALVGAWMLALG